MGPPRRPAHLLRISRRASTRSPPSFEHRRQLLRFDVVGARPSGPIGSQICHDFDVVAQSVGPRLPRHAHRRTFLGSSGPIRSYPNWFGELLPRNPDHRTFIAGHRNPYPGNGKAILTTTALPVGSNNLFAVYNGDANYGSSTSPVIVQVVLAKPGHCDDSYNNWFYGTPGSPDIQGSSGNNFFWLPSGSFWSTDPTAITASGVATGTTATPAATATMKSLAATGTTASRSATATTTSRSGTDPTKSTSAAVTTRSPWATETAITCPWAMATTA